MPIMLRPNKKATKIAYAILGTPANIKNKKSAFRKDIKQQLDFQATSRSK